jgi:hypothetical protein
MTTLPTIHLNGTGASSLFEEYEAAWRAVRAAGEAISAATCNQRDFYPQSPEAWSAALAERAEMFRKLGEVEQYLADWAQHASTRIR